MSNRREKDTEIGIRWADLGFTGNSKKLKVRHLESSER
jgi:hypothetical protein